MNLFNSWSSIDLNRFTVWSLCGVIGGTAAGAVSRLSMRLIALEAGMQPGFSVGGTLGILIIGAIMGIPFAFLYAAIRRFIPLPERYRGLAYGLMLSALFIAVPFIFFAEGELSLVDPLLGILFFLPVPLTFGLLLTIIYPKLDERSKGIAQTKQVHLLWLVLLGLAFVFSLISMGRLIFRYPLFPQTITQFYTGVGIPSTTAAQLHNWFTGVFMLVYVGLALFIFWRGAHLWMAKYAALTFLVLAGSFFTRGIFPGESMNAIPVARVFPAIIRPMGWAMLLVLIYVFPDGHWRPRWTRWAALFWIGVFFVWFSGLFERTLLDISSWPLPAQISLLIAALVSGLVAQVIRFRRSSPEQRRRTRLVLLGLAFTALLFSALWLAMIFDPDLMPRTWIDKRLMYLFSFSPYLLPWLLIPLSLSYAMLRHDLWSPIGVEDQFNWDATNLPNLSNHPEEVKS